MKNEVVTVKDCPCCGEDHEHILRHHDSLKEGTEVFLTCPKTGRDFKGKVKAFKPR